MRERENERERERQRTRERQRKIGGSRVGLLFKDHEGTIIRP